MDLLEAGSKSLASSYVHNLKDEIGKYCLGYCINFCLGAKDF